MFAATGQAGAPHDRAVDAAAAPAGAPARRRAGLAPAAVRGPRAGHRRSRWCCSIAVTAVANPRFLSAQSIKDLLLGSTILAILAVGQAIVDHHPQRRPLGRLGPRACPRSRPAACSWPRPALPIPVVARSSAWRSGARAAARSTAA